MACYLKNVVIYRKIIIESVYMQRLNFVKEQISSNPNRTGPLSGKTVVVTGGSRGIGLAIAVRCAQDGANVAILAKTVTDQPTLPGIAQITQELSLQQLTTSKKQGGKPYPSLATSETRPKSKNVSLR